MKRILLGTLLAASFTAQAATIAVIDSGVDVEHADFNGKIWINQTEIADNGRDEDRNGYQDDVYGWNFAEGNNLVIDRKYLGTFSQDPHTFFEIQGRMFMGTATEEDIAWVKAKRGDEAFIKEMGKFGNFVHGTHVAGITQAESADAKILAVKLIPTEVKLPGQNLVGEEVGFAPTTVAESNTRMKLVKTALKALAGQQMNLMDEIFYYVGQHKATVANGSFGTGFDQAKGITGMIFKVIFFRNATEQESEEVTRFFMDELIVAGAQAVAQAPNTLFVFAAGNSGMNNDKYPTSPTNIQADNVISVAATYEYEFIAPFSNYGTKEVDVAAPGMLIHSQIPGNDYLKVSGTSQAAPYVAKIAGQINDLNKNLSPKQVKQIIMGTVDEKSFLAGKVSTKGIVNTDRAVFAARRSLTMSVDAAILSSRTSVADVITNRKSAGFFKANADLVVPMALPSMFR